eukprot:1156480-Pelagomonas_calceolata.AAC.2
MTGSVLGTGAGPSATCTLTDHWSLVTIVISDRHRATTAADRRELEILERHRATNTADRREPEILDRHRATTAADRRTPEILDRHRATDTALPPW